MIRGRPRVFSAKVKLSNKTLYKHSEAIKDTFQYILKGYTNKSFRVDVKFFKIACSYRFTVIFDKKPLHPEAFDNLIAKVAERTIETFK